MQMQDSAAEECVSVAIRLRPLNKREINNKESKIFSAQGNSVVQQQTKDRDGGTGCSETLHYDKVFGEDVDNASVYEHMARGIVNGVMGGINGTIFAYGQTSSGKTHTMLGGSKQGGILELAAQQIFAHIDACSSRNFVLRVSFVEIYNEVIRDLLTDHVSGMYAGVVNMREDPRRGVYCEATEQVVVNLEDVMAMMRKGIGKRSVEATSMNETSSRSHTIFTVVVESMEKHWEEEDADGALLVSSLNLVDLAGSESVRHTGATGQRAKEGGKINQSLLSLSRVIHSLGQSNNGHVSYRDSKLTRLLQRSLSGFAKMSIVACITTSDKYLEETRSTLQFASRAKLVKTNATVNEVIDEATALRRLRKELADLKEKRRNSGAHSINAYDESCHLRGIISEHEATITQLQDALQKSHSTQETLNTVIQMNAECEEADADSDGDTIPLEDSFEENKNSLADTNGDKKDTLAEALLTVVSRDEEILLMKARTAKLEFEVIEIDSLRNQVAAANKEHSSIQCSLSLLRKESKETNAWCLARMQDLGHLIIARDGDIVRLKSLLSESVSKNFALVESTRSQRLIIQEHDDREKSLLAELVQSASNTSSLEAIILAMKQATESAENETKQSLHEEKEKCKELHKDVLALKSIVSDLELAVIEKSEEYEAFAKSTLEKQCSVFSAYENNVSDLKDKLEQSTIYAISIEGKVADLTLKFNDATACVTSSKIRELELSTRLEEALASVQKFEDDSNNYKLVATNHRSEIEVTQKSLDAAKRETQKSIACIKSELGVKEAEISRLMSVNTILEDKIREFEHRLAETNDFMSLTRESDESNKKRISQLQTSVDLLKQEKDKAANNAVAVELENKRIFGSLHAEEERLKNELRTIIGQYAALESRADKGAILMKENAELKLRIQSLQKSHDSTVDCLTSLQAEANELRGECKDLQTKLISFADMQDLREELTLSYKREVCFKSTIADLERDCQELAQRAKESHDEVTTLKTEWDKCEKDSEAGVVLLQSELSISKARVDTLSSELGKFKELSEGNMRALQDKFQALENELLTKKNQEAELECENQRLSELVATSVSSVDYNFTLESMHKLTEELSAWTLASEAFQAEKDILLEKESTSKARAIVLENDISRLKEHGKQLLANADSKCIILQDKCAALLTELSAKDDALAETENELFQLKQESEGSPDILNDSIKALNEEIIAKDERIAHLEKSKLTKDQLDKIRQVKEDRSRLSTENKDLKKRIEKLKSTVSETPVLQTLREQMSELMLKTEANKNERQNIISLLSLDVDDKNLDESAIVTAITNLIAQAKQDSSDEKILELEERIGIYKDAARGSREEIARLSQQIKEFQHTLPSAEANLSVKNDTASSEVLLEEEIATPSETKKIVTTSKTVSIHSNDDLHELVAADENDPNLKRLLNTSTNEEGSDCAQS